MFKFMGLIPKPILWGILGIALQALIVVFVWDKASTHEQLKFKEQQTKLVNKEISDELEKLSAKIQNYNEFKSEVNTLLAEQKVRLENVNTNSIGVKERLDEILNRPDTNCNTLLDGLFGVYVDMYNKKPPTR